MPDQPRPRKILYVAPMNPGRTSLYRFQAFERIAQQVVPFDVDAYQPSSKYLAALRYRYPAGPLIARINRELLRTVREQKPDLVWFDKPVNFTPATIEAVKATGAPIVCYNQDSPFGPRNDGCWLQFMRVYRLFDLHCLFRGTDVVRYRDWGLPFVKVLFSYDPLQHYPPVPGWSDANRTREVSYVGSPLEQRPAFLEKLGNEQKIPLSVAGPRWDSTWPAELREKYVTGGMMKGPAYRESIWESKINLAFVTHSNEDDVAHKSIEIAACGQFLLAERAPGHQEAFEEGREAVFFGSVEECAEKARYYLDHPAEREGIAAAGRARALHSGYDNDSQIRKVLSHLDAMQLGAPQAKASAGA